MNQKKVADLFTMDYPFESLVDRIKKNRLRLDPEFQRKYKWDKDGFERCSKCIESCLIRIPLPACYLSESMNEQGEDVLDVIDGVQRLTTVYNFFNNDFALQDLSVFSELNGKRFRDLGKFKAELETTTIRCVVLRKDNPRGIVQEIFARLNKGAVELSAQEIRHALYPGNFDRLLQRLALKDEIARFKCSKLGSRHQKVDSREAEELVLRYFAFNMDLASYADNASKWMDKAMADLSIADGDSLQRLEQEFLLALTNCVMVFGSDVFCNLANKNKRQSFSIYDVQMFCLGKMKKDIVAKNRMRIYAIFLNLCKRKEFRSTLTVRLSSRSNIEARRKMFASDLESCIL